MGEAEDVFSELSDDELRAETDHFKQRLEDGESLDDIQVEAFAAVREGQARLAMIPVDNSVAGRVADVHHLLLAPVDRSRVLRRPVVGMLGYGTAGAAALGALVGALYNGTAVPMAVVMALAALAGLASRLILVR